MKLHTPSVVLALATRRFFATIFKPGEVLFGAVSELLLVVLFAYALRGGTAMLVGESQTLSYSLAGLLGVTAFQAGFTRGVTVFFPRDLDFFFTTSAPRASVGIGLLLGEVIDRSVISGAQFLVLSVMMSPTWTLIAAGLAATVATVAMGVGLAMATAVVLKTPMIALRILTVAVLPQALICGAYFPVPAQGAAIRAARHFMPIEYAVDLFRHAAGVSDTGGDTHAVSLDLSVCLVLAVGGALVTGLLLDRLRGRPVDQFEMNAN